MKFRRNKKDFFEFENDRKTHVKLYKAGKQWVSSLISSIGLIRVFKGKLDKSTMNTQLVSKEKDKKSEDKLSSDGIAAALKGVAALGAVAGGTVLTANTALADTKQLDSNQNLVNKDTVNLSSGSGSSSTSDSLSTSESNTQSAASVSKSESVSLDTNSSSASETRSDSNSRSESISESKSDSNSQSVSSQTTSKSESLASTSLENSQTTTGTTAKDKLQGLINQATDFVNSDAFKSSSSDLKTALAATVEHYADVMQSSTSLTEQDYQYGIDGLTLLMNEIKSPSSSIKPNVFMTSASTSSNSTYNPVSAASDDIGSVYNTTNGLRWIYGDNKVWGRLQDAFTSRESKQNIWMANANFKITKASLGNGKDHWTITFFPYKGLMYDPSSNPDPYGLYNARFGFLLTKDYTITSKKVDIKVDVDLKHPTFGGYKPQVDSTKTSFDFNPNTDVNKTDGHVNNSDFIGDKGANGYIQETYYISNNVNESQTSNLLQNRIYQGNSYDTLETEDQTARQKSRILTEDGNVVGKNGVISKDAFGTAMYMRSYGTLSDQMYASYTISFDTLHSNEVQKNLPLGTNGGAFSGVYASVDTAQWKGALYKRNLLGEFYGEESMKNDTVTNGNLPGFESDSKATSESNSQSTLQSQSTSLSESLSASTSLSESLSASTSLSESLSASTSLSESLSASTSLSESLSASTSLSESLSASTSLSESLSASTSLSESLSASTSLSESLSASTSLSESLSASTSLSESLSASTSLSESLSASTSLSESLSASTSLSESLSASTSLSESLSASTSLSESLSASTSLSESLSASTSLSESLSASTSLSESLSTSSSLSTSLSGSSSMNTDESDSISRSLSESESLSTSISSSLSESLSVSSSLSGSESLSTSSSLSASASLIDSLSESLSNTISSENMNDGNMIGTTNPGSVNKVSSESLKHNVQHKKLPQTGDSSANTGVLGGLFVLTSLTLLRDKKKRKD
ncbi:accessory Sec-dependent serine-rich glycoprotein adhesin [Ligilactobacillus salivarius]|uniref:accessory Sec-dependent serine-rich glycoprotein adhesin n=1 Tax=Ligilactobacillus salivarius TaxID=1624 RepID=UPI0025A42830|nr:accessory Sec-dependent serine-rich glycoprotein adhesin [Ligilactobacillus salivarius]MDM8273317.1 accessory Sec-dependent serine-rich glycoprotein adhesin [Ligilactobacillus salivarius]